MGIPRIDSGPMTVEEFYAFTDARPDEEKWELIDGEAVLNASPSELHQRILKNLLVALAPQERGGEAGWAIIPGIGAVMHYVVIAEDSLDVIELSRDGGLGERTFQSRTDVIALNPPGVSLPMADIYRNTGILSTSGQ